MPDTELPKGKYLVVYGTPTYVRVEDGVITRVSIADEAPILDRIRTVSLNLEHNIADLHAVINWVEYEADWPAWDFG